MHLVVGAIIGYAVWIIYFFHSIYTYQTSVDEHGIFIFFDSEKEVLNYRERCRQRCFENIIKSGIHSIAGNCFIAEISERIVLQQYCIEVFNSILNPNFKCMQKIYLDESPVPDLQSWFRKSKSTPFEKLIKN